MVQILDLFTYKGLNRTHLCLMFLVMGGGCTSPCIAISREVLPIIGV